MSDKSIWIVHTEADSSEADKIAALLDRQMFDVRNDYIGHEISKGRDRAEVVKEFISQSDIVIALLSKEMDESEIDSDLRFAGVTGKSRVVVCLSHEQYEIAESNSSALAPLLAGCDRVDWSRPNAFVTLLSCIRDLTAPLPEPSIEAYAGKEPFIFISYSHKDSSVVYPAIEHLHRLGYRIWYDEGIDPGNEWPDEVANALDRSSFFIVFISPRSVESQNVRNEINFALNNRKPFLAIHLEETALKKGLALRMGDIQAVFKYRMPDERYWRKLQKALPSTLLESRPVSAGRATETLDVFVCFGQGDEEMAEQVANFIKERSGKSVFYSSARTDDEASTIDRMLESAQCFVAVGSRLEHLTARWPEYEYRTFHIDMHSGRKPNGRLLSFVLGIDPVDLPLPLRRYPVITCRNESEIPEALLSLLAYLNDDSARKIKPTV